MSTQQQLPTINNEPQQRQAKPKPASRQKSRPEPVPAAEGYTRTMRHVASLSVKNMPMKHREILSQKIRDLQDAGARLADGTEVTDKTKAILWILESIDSVG